MLGLKSSGKKSRAMAAVSGTHPLLKKLSCTSEASFFIACFLYAMGVQIHILFPDVKLLSPVGKNEMSLFSLGIQKKNLMLTKRLSEVLLEADTFSSSCKMRNKQGVSSFFLPLSLSHLVLITTALKSIFPNQTLYSLVLEF